ncbi:putative integral membrane protein [Babesia bovis T2Bo]|uniref:putative integral membrane protein n=1 Tax=Babesia bovis T2Bo TaxID=484906 RepID=UPI001D2C83F8|nr:putative integral membrane protein [Babesia bovis T2Bo]KAG6439952.1 putative integral membrane protein [Babesia bovis T2Bo]
MSLAMSGNSQQYGGLRTVTKYYPVLLSTIGFPLLAVHLVSLGITWYCIEYKKIFHWPKDYMCFGLLAAVVILVAVVAIAVAYSGELEDEHVQYTLLGYSILLMVPVFWYAYRCGLLTWRWNSCLPKKKSLNGNDTAEHTESGTDIAKES